MKYCDHEILNQHSITAHFFSDVYIKLVCVQSVIITIIIIIIIIVLMT